MYQENTNGDKEKTKWKKKKNAENKKEKNAKNDNKENFNNFTPQILEEDETQKIKKKMINMRENKTKLPPLENIYEMSEKDDAFEDLKRELGTNNETDFPHHTAEEFANMSDFIKQMTVNNDFADKELLNKLNNIQNIELDFKNKIKSDQFCKDSSYNLSFVNANFFDYLIIPFYYIDYFIKKTGIYLCDFLSKNKSTEDEKKLVISKIQMFLSILISVFILYNWFFLGFYEKNGEHTQTFDFSKEKITNLNYYLNYFFEFVLYPIQLFNWIVLIFIPDKAKVLLRSNFIWIVLFLAIIYFLYNYGNSLVEFFYNSILIFTTLRNVGSFKNTQTGTYYNVLYALIALGILISFLSNFVYHTIMMVIFKHFFSLLISFIIRIVFSFYFVSISAILLSVYLLSYSFFGMSLFSTDPINETTKKIREYIHKSSFEDVKTCNSNSIFHKIIEFLQLIVNLTYIYIVEIVLIVMLIYSIFDYFSNIHTFELKVYLINMSLFIIFIIGLVSTSINYYHIKKKMISQ